MLQKPLSLSLSLSLSLVLLYHCLIILKVRNLGVCLDSNLSMDQHVKRLCGIAFLELRRKGHFGATYLLIRLRNWFHLSFCQGGTTATLCWRVSRNTGWIACREYNIMQLVLSLADEGETMQSHRGRIEYKTSTCALEAELHLLLPICLIFSLPSNLPALCVPQTWGLMALPRIKTIKFGRVS